MARKKDETIREDLVLGMTEGVMIKEYSFDSGESLVSLDFRNVKYITTTLNKYREKMGRKSVSSATIRNMLKAFVTEGLVRERGICGWGKSYSYQWVTAEERKKADERKKKFQKREKDVKTARKMLKDLGIPAEENRWGELEVSPATLIKILKMAKVEKKG